MAVVFVGADSALDVSVAIPTHQAGDLIVVLARRQTSGSITVPAGWTVLDSDFEGSPRFVLAWREATSGSTASGTWTGAAGLVVQVHRDTGGVGAFAVSRGGAGSAVTLPALALDEPGESWVAVMAGPSSSTTIQDATGLTVRHGSASAGQMRAWDTAGPVTSYAGETLSSASFWVAVAYELLEGSVPMVTSGSLGLAGAATLSTGVPMATSGSLGIAGAASMGVTLHMATSGSIGMDGSAVLIDSSPITVRPAPRPLEKIIAGSGRHRARVDVLSGPRAGESLPVLSGSITVDAAADVRRTGSLAVAAVEGWIPETAASALDVRSGTEVQVWQGVVDDEDREHWWSQGVFAIGRVSVSQAPDGVSLDLDVADRAHRIKRAKIRRRWAADGEDRILASIATVLAEVAPWLPLAIDTTGDIVFQSDAVIAEYGDDVWSKCRGLARSMSRDLHVDRDGVCVAPPIVDPLTAAPLPLPLLTSRTLTVDTDDLVNVVGCPWEEARPDDVPDGWVPDGGVSEAVDSSSSTGVQSPVGPCVTTYSGDTSVIHTATHAQLAAQSELMLRMGLQQAAAASCKPDPRLDVGIPVEVDGVTHIVSRLAIDLQGGTTDVDMGAASPDIALMMAAQTRPPGEYQTTEIVTGLAPLRSRSVTDPGGAEVAVEWTDALAGVEVGDPITVLHKGAGRRVGVAIQVKKTIKDKHAGETVAKIGGVDVGVDDTVAVRARIGSSGGYSTATGSGGQVTIDLPAVSVPEAASPNHRHPRGNIVMPNLLAPVASTSVAFGSTWNASTAASVASVENAGRAAYNQLRADVNALASTIENWTYGNTGTPTG